MGVPARNLEKNKETGWIAVRLRPFAFILALAACCLVTGCWNRVELNELAITSATSFDKIDDKTWEISYQVVIPSAISAGTGTSGGGGGPSLPVIVYSTNGPTIREAISNSYRESSRKLFFAHNRVFIISEKVAREGLDQIIDLYLRNPDARETVNILVTSGKAKHILEQLTHIEKIPGEAIQKVISIESRNASILPNIMVYELAQATLGESKSAVIPEIYLSGGVRADNMDELKRTHLGSAMKLGRLAVLKEGKMVGWLSKEEALGVSFMSGKFKSGNITFACSPESDGSEKTNVRLLTSTTKLTPKLENGKLTMGINIKGTGILQETNCSLDLNKPANIAQLENGLRQELQKIIEASWKKTKDMKVDVMGFGEAVHHKYPKEWKKMKKDWSSVLASATIELHIKSSIVHVGLSNKSFKLLNRKEGGD